MARRRPLCGSAIWVFLVLALLALARVQARAQDLPAIPNAGALLDGWDRQLAEAALALAAPDLSPGRAAAQQRALRRLLDRGHTLEARLATARATLQAEIDVLGPAPASAAPPDPLAAVRQRTLDAATRIDVALRRVRLDRLAAQRLITAIGLRRQQELRQEILQRTPPPLSATTWRMASAEAAAAWARLRTDLARAPEPLSAVHWLLLGLILLMLAGVAARRVLQAHGAPTRRIRLLAALADAVPALFVTVVGILFLHALIGRELFGGAMLDALLIGAGKALLGALVLLALGRAASGAGQPDQGLLDLSAADARLLWRRMVLLAWIFAVPTIALTVVHDGRVRDPALLSVVALLDSLLKLGTICLLLAPRFWQPAAATLGAGRTQLLRGLCLVAFAVPVPLAIAGHAELAEQWLSRLLVAAALFAAALLARAALAGLLLPRTAPALVTGIAEDAGDLPAPQGAPVLLVLAFDAVLALALLYLLLLLINISPGLMRAWGVLLYDGIAIGNHVFSLRALVAAAVAVALVLIAVRLVVRLIAAGVLRRTRLDRGVQDAIATFLGYLGIVIAAAIGISMLGISLSSLALVAGALSVGAGFGLRQLVENIIAGLLLLIERPIRAGDWIVVGGQEGIVRRISARATQMETFDRATVILPNAQLTGGALTNWTHADRVARIVVAVSVPAGSPAETVRRILLDAALAHPRVLAAPPPVALFVRFGHLTLGFELRCFVSDTAWFSTVKSDLHYAIDAAFHEAGILEPRTPAARPAAMSMPKALSDAG